MLLSTGVFLDISDHETMVAVKTQEPWCGNSNNDDYKDQETSDYARFFSCAGLHYFNSPVLCTMNNSIYIPIHQARLHPAACWQDRSYLPETLRFRIRAENGDAPIYCLHIGYDVCHESTRCIRSSLPPEAV